MENKPGKKRPPKDPPERGREDGEKYFNWEDDDITYTPPPWSHQNHPEDQEQEDKDKDNNKEEQP